MSEPKGASLFWLGLIFSLVHCHSQNVGCGKGVRSQLCEAPVGPFRQLTPDPFTTTTPKLNGDKALDAISTEQVMNGQ